MPKCCVKDCGYRNESLFSVPKNLKNEWEIALNMNLNHNSRICATHLNPDDIISTWECGVGASKYSICLKRPKLKAGTIPVKILKINEDLIFSNNDVHCVQHDHTYFKYENTPDSQSYETQHAEGNYLLNYRYLTRQMQNVSDNSLKELLANSGVSDIQGELIRHFCHS
ncbi:uncharacterized protein LOC132933238 [Metopolophium dirhodum]|uniref:uncharacterized protein LOC132933238 n=1 Tax=Metopolophium dirhodum TaxID=44670 RepID=UPI00298FF3EB|nr:uncharacterized protein LOC132933238 [Metopolophium dirhodum]